MPPILAQSAMSPLAQSDGRCLLNAPEAMLKGVLEAEIEISLVIGPRAGTFASLFALSNDATVSGLLRQHGIRLTTAPDAGRALTLAHFAARAGRAALCMIPNDQLDDVIHLLNRVNHEALDRGGALGLILEDLPLRCPASCPRRAAQRLGLPCLEPVDVEQLRSSMEFSLRLSRAGRCPIGVVSHWSILRSSDTLEAQPNRAAAAADILLARKRRNRSPRWSETGGMLRVARRLELNTFRALPSPGERVSVGFITVGPADASLQHLTHVLGLHGRVPVMQLGLIQPIDDSAVERLLERCQHVVVLEPRPGSIEASVLAAAEGMRRRGEQPANVWGRALPPDEAGMIQTMAGDADLHPSVLVRKIAHLLHAIRPTLQVGAQLTAEPPPLPVRLSPREEHIGAYAALAAVRRIVTDVDQWLRDRAPLAERDLPPTGLAIDGAEAVGGVQRTVQVELWSHSRFQRDGVGALVQAARDERPWILLVCEIAAEDVRDLERLARGAIPAETTDRVTLHTANLNDTTALRDLIREASLQSGLAVIIVRDGPPARYDVAALEQSLIEIDQLGFEPLQRLVRAVDDLSAIRPNADEREPSHDAPALQSEFSTDTLVSRSGAKVRMKIRPLLEEVEVVRSKPPVHGWLADASLRLPMPQVVHGRQPRWRAHLAGIRRDVPGLVANVLCEAGRAQGYHVRTICDGSPIGAGRRAFTQVLFANPRPGEPCPFETATIPFGEADVLLGMDAAETLRATDPAAMLRVASAVNTFVVANLGEIDGSNDERGLDTAKFTASLRAVSRHEHRLFGDFSAACRTSFHTDRVADMAMLGAAYQRGLIPLALESLEAAIAVYESRGYGRSREAFEFGRRLAIDERLFTKPVEIGEEEVNRLLRRLVLALQSRWGGRRRAKRFGNLLRRTLEAMPGLGETESARAARNDLVLACHRCLIWGGIEYAQKYCETLCALYRVDRAESGRALTRCAVLPLAEAMLIRDPIYLASVAGGAEQRRRTRHLLNIKHARGDRIERRYLTRFELIVFDRRFRADVRTSDWLPRVGTLLRGLVPTRWRGTRREREMREYILQFMKSAIESGPHDYPRFAEAMQRLHLQASEDRLRGMAMAELKMLVEPKSLLLSTPGNAETKSLSATSDFVDKRSKIEV